MTDSLPTAKALTFGYTNWRGEFAVRTAVPLEMWWGIGTHHGETPMWFIKAWDTEKNAERDFALKDMSPATLAMRAEELEAALRLPDAKRRLWFISDKVSRDGYFQPLRCL